jgi:predicted RNase H-like nuclease (RuvC/YqgF family)
MIEYVNREVLLQIKRVYSKDEIIADLNRQLKESNFKIGVLESQVAELEDENKLLRKNGETNRQDDYVKNLKLTIDSLIKSKQKFKKLSEELIYKNSALYNQINNA